MSDYEAAELARNSSPELLAHLLVTERAERSAERASHFAEVAGLRTALDQAQRIGIAVLRMHGRGRKTVRISSLIEEQS